MSAARPWPDSYYRRVAEMLFVEDSYKIEADRLEACSQRRRLRSCVLESSISNGVEQCCRIQFPAAYLRRVNYQSYPSLRAASAPGSTAVRRREAAVPDMPRQIRIPRFSFLVESPDLRAVSGRRTSSSRCADVSFVDYKAPACGTDVTPVVGAAAQRASEFTTIYTRLTDMARATRSGAFVRRGHQLCFVAFVGEEEPTKVVQAPERPLIQFRRARPD